MNKGTANNGDRGGTRREAGHYRRYPEEEFIDAQETADDQPARAGEELAEHLRAVMGRAGRSRGEKG